MVAFHLDSIFESPVKKYPQANQGFHFEMFWQSFQIIPKLTETS